MASSRQRPIARPDAAEVLLDSYTRMPAPELDRAMQARFPKSIEHLSSLQVCCYCNRTFAESENMGRWACAYHPGQLFSGPTFSGYRYNCCGQSPEQSGCLSCDHSTVRIYESAYGFVFMSLPSYVINAACMKNSMPPPDAIIYEEPAEMWVEQEFRVASEIGQPSDRLEIVYESLTRPTSLYVQRVDIARVRMRPEIAALPYFSNNRRV